MIIDLHLLVAQGDGLGRTHLGTCTTYLAEVSIDDRFWRKDILERSLDEIWKVPLYVESRREAKRSYGYILYLLIQDLYLLRISPFKPSLSSSLDGEKLLDEDADDPTDSGIKGKRVPTSEDQSKGTGVPVVRPFPLHPNDPVRNGQGRINDLAEFCQHPCKIGVIGPRLEVPLGLAHPRDTAEDILHPKREECL